MGFYYHLSCNEFGVRQKTWAWMNCYEGQLSAITFTRNLANTILFRSCVQTHAQEHRKSTLFSAFLQLSQGKTFFCIPVEGHVASRCKLRNPNCLASFAVLFAVLLSRPRQQPQQQHQQQPKQHNNPNTNHNNHAKLSVDLSLGCKRP